MILGVDIGGTSVKLALVDAQGNIHARHEASTCFDGYRTPMLDTVLRQAGDFLARQDARVEGIGVSATGQIDTRTGTVIGTNGMIPNYEGARIRERMQARFQLPVYVLNDANAAALGECFAGCARGRRDVLMVTFGTGVGGGIIIDGRIYGGARGIAGEIGQFVLRRNGEPGGWFEDVASTGALVRAAERALGETGLNGRILFERAERGDAAVLWILDAWMEDIAAGLIGLVHIFNPEMLVLGGGVSVQRRLFVEPLRAKVLAGAQPRFVEGLEIESAVLGNDAGVLGVARYFMEMNGRRD